MKKICVIGLGYIGLPTAAMFANHGMEVVGVDINNHVIETVNKGGIHIQEAGLAEIVQDAFQSGFLKAMAKPQTADAFVIAVPTPFNEDKTADMRAVISATESIVPFLRQGNLVILESTSPPMTTVNLVKPILEKSGLTAGEDFFLVYSPERVLPGQILNELVNNARVIGGLNQRSAEAGRDLYKIFVKGDIVLTDATTAEMVKLMENTYRDVNIAIANEFSRLADRFEIDVWEAIRIANRHPRVQILNPGPGVGGHCISVDPWFLVEAAPDLTPLISTARRVNDAQPSHVVEIVKKAIGQNLVGKKIAALGLSYKADVDDLRESPAIEVVKRLAAAGADVLAYEPFQRKVKFPEFRTAVSLEDTLVGAGLIILLAGHRQFRTLNPKDISNLTAARIVVDAVNAWSDVSWAENGFKVYRIGVGSPHL